MAGGGPGTCEYAVIKTFCAVVSGCECPAEYESGGVMYYYDSDDCDCPDTSPPCTDLLPCTGNCYYVLRPPVEDLMLVGVGV